MNDRWQGAHSSGTARGGRTAVTIITAVLAVAAFLGYRGDFPGLSPAESSRPVAVPISAAQRPPLDSGAVAAGVEPALVDIDAFTRPFGRTAAGSGIVLTADGQVLTNHHVVKGAHSVRVSQGSDDRVFQAEVLGYDSTADIALLSLTGASELAAARIGSSDDLRMQEQVLAIGNAGGTGNTTAVPGRITDLDSTIQALNSNDLTSKTLFGMLEVSAAVSSGQSGGAIADHDGEVVGVVTAASGYQPPSESRPAEEPNGYAVPIDSAMQVVQQIRSGRSTDTVHIGATPNLGVLISDASPLGARVDSTVYGQPAAEAGLADGEIITAVDDRPVTSAASLRDAINRYQPDQTVLLDLRTPSGGQRCVRVVLADGTPN